MTSRLTRTLEALQSRPAAERRVLAVTTYGALAAIILAFWVVSFQNLVTPLAMTNETMTPATNVGDRVESPEEALAPNLASPFETLRETVRGITSAIRELRDLAQNQGTRDTSSATEREESSLETARTAETPPPIRESREPPPVHPSGVARALVADLERTSRESEQLSRLLAPTVRNDAAATREGTSGLRPFFTSMLERIRETYQAIIR